MKKVLFIVVTMILFVFGGCGESNEEVIKEEMPKEIHADEPILNENGKEEITLSTLFLSVDLQETIIEYNKQSEYYEIVPIEAGSMTAEDFRNRIQLEMSNGGGPDIISDNSLTNLDMQPYAEKGYLLEVTDFLAEQGALCEKVVEYNCVNEKIYGVPVSFSIRTMITSKEFVDNKEMWTKEYCMEALEESQARVFAPAPYGWTSQESGLYILNLLGVGMEGIQLFVDEEYGISSFEQEEFIELLTFSKKYSDFQPQDADAIRVKDGEIFCVDGEISKFSDFALWNEYFEGTPCYVGYPSDCGGKYMLMVDSYYVNAASSHKDGALDFLSYLLSNEQQEKRIENSFPVRQDVLETMWEKAKQEVVETATAYETSGILYEPRVVTDEEEMIFWEMLESAIYYKWKNDIWEIVWEEALPYYYGKKTEEGVALLIDNRVQLYLDERK